MLERRISCQIDSATIEQILDKVVNENDLFFSYNPDILPKGKNTLNLLNVSVRAFLQRLLPPERYEIENLDNQIIITIIETSPVKLSGIVVEGRDDAPVPYASLGIEGESIGTMTNVDGRYDFIIPWRLRNQSVTVRCLGFEPIKLSQNELKGDAVIRMEPVSIHLREIEVKPVIVADLLKNFRNNIEKNYELSTQLMITFYRETIRRDDQYIGVWEAIMEMLKSPY